MCWGAARPGKTPCAPPPRPRLQQDETETQDERSDPSWVQRLTCVRAQRQQHPAALPDMRGIIQPLPSSSPQKHFPWPPSHMEGGGGEGNCNRLGKGWKYELSQWKEEEAVREEAPEDGRGARGGSLERPSSSAVCQCRALPLWATHGYTQVHALSV